eukprot:CAMPEP_0170179844 /NCGR_PEP_ID=MMETSP0040_2-20121228/19449_1 /TAXON_ID=641309 /ORGANISM="Lotharella oceanica, Strain CCMP622" /LENGTH=86 /DNA_ID=CAMNT_0010424177 /DNA_START=124 /DNA_END=381 /DNA_ORIENTATION=-
MAAGRPLGHIEVAADEDAFAGHDTSGEPRVRCLASSPLSSPRPSDVVVVASPGGLAVVAVVEGATFDHTRDVGQSRGDDSHDATGV